MLPESEALTKAIVDFLEKWAIPGQGQAMARDLVDICFTASKFGAAAANEGAMQAMQSVFNEYKAKHGKG